MVTSWLGRYLESTLDRNVWLSRSSDDYSRWRTDSKHASSPGLLSWAVRSQDYVINHFAWNGVGPRSIDFVPFFGTVLPQIYLVPIDVNS